MPTDRARERAVEQDKLGAFCAAVERAEAAESLVLESQLQLVDANIRLAKAIAAKRDEAMRNFQLTERVKVFTEALEFQLAWLRSIVLVQAPLGLSDAINRAEAALSQVPAEDKQNEAERELAEAKRDTERLEWVGANRAIIYLTSSSDPEKAWTCYLNTAPHYYWGKAMREAIDAAMSSSQPPAQEQQSQP